MMIRFVSFFLVIAFATTNPAWSAELLTNAASPYLRSHAKDPVEWRQWDSSAFSEAKRTGKPIYVSVGYSACHWCHVMQEESFSDPIVASVINKHFIPILVDREERPDIDAQLIRSAALMGSATGWPLNIFLTPEGTPFYAGTYFPATAQRGMPSFTTTLLRINNLYTQNKEELVGFKDQFNKSFEQAMSADVPQDLTPARWLSITQKLEKFVDPFNGGFGTAPKFPQFPALRTLWRSYQRTGNVETKEAALNSMEAMIAGGLYDHLGGGFARYATDPAWLIPHFEKMLDINAMALLTLVDMWRETRSANLEYAIRGTTKFLLNEMKLKGGGFASSLDADSEGEEGTFYVWTEDEIDKLLGEDATIAKKIYGITKEGNWEGKSILHRQDADLFETPDKTKIDKILLAHRDKRIRPQRDDKVLADWNGLVISALVEAGAALGEPQWIKAARRAFSFVQVNLNKGGALRHSWSSGQRGKIVILGDYGSMALAALNLYEFTGEDAYLDQAVSWVKQAETLWSQKDQVYLTSPPIKETTLPSYKTVEDNASPAGNALMAEVITRLTYSGKLPHLKNRPEQIIAPYLKKVERSPRYFGGLLNAMDTFLSTEQIVIIGNRSNHSTADLIKATFSTDLPARTLQVIAPGTSLPDNHPAKNKGQINGRATAYICVGTLCSFPVTEPKEFKKIAEDMRGMTYMSAKKKMLLK
ncbi:MAG: thioredoxin domain-containing protein [Rhodospirillales bacterium]|nr:thioredoxin domain-containing protein [Rhodospirillales bacterium]